MNEDNEFYRILESYEKKIKMLESELSTKDIIIDALISKVKYSKVEIQEPKSNIYDRYENASKKLKLSNGKEIGNSCQIEQPKQSIQPPAIVQQEDVTPIHIGNQDTPIQSNSPSQTQNRNNIRNINTTTEATQKIKQLLKENRKKEKATKLARGNNVAKSKKRTRALKQPQIKNKKKITQQNKQKNTEEIPINQPELTPKKIESLPGLYILDSDDTPNTVENFSIPINKHPIVDASVLITQIKEMFSPKSKTTVFKQNCTFLKFVEYCESSYEFSLKNKKISKCKNPLKLFITSNLDRIIKYLIDNINTLKMNQICSTFFIINSEIDYSYKLVIFHDIILEIENYSRLNFIASALFNNNDLECDLFSQIIKKIMFHQLCIDHDFYKDAEVVEYLNTISENIVLSAPAISLWETLSHFMVKHEFFDPVKQVVKAEAIEKGFLMRMVCHYLDWNYTYNSFIVTQLFPKITSDRAPIHVYYLGILAMNAIRLFGSDESINMIVDELKNILEWKDSCSVVAYLILKQIYEVECEDWILNNSEFITKLGFNLDYVKKILLI